MSKMLKTRLINGAIAAVVLLALIFWLPSWLYIMVLVSICTLILIEFFALLDKASISTFRTEGIAAAILYNLALWAECQYKLSTNLELLAIFIIFCSLFLRQLREKNNDDLFDNLGSTLLGFLYIPFLFSFITRIQFYDGTFSGQWLLFYLLAMIKISDSGAFFAGTYLGRHHMAPRISPKKTWEGLAGGILAGLAASLVIFTILGGDFVVLQMRLSDAVALGILLPSIGALGDLSESLIKRAANAKDSSTVLKGLGGMLDLADSVLPAIPLLYFWCRFIIK